MKFLLFLAPALLLAALTTTPRPTSTLWNAAPTSLLVPAPSPTPNLALLLRRNPFAALASSSNTNDPLPNTLPVPQTLDNGAPTTVPDPGQLTPSQAASFQTVSLLGIIMGNGHQPMALVQIGTTTAVIEQGGLIGVRHVAQITPEGIIFDDHSRLALATSTQSILPSAPPAPQLPMQTPPPTPEPTQTPQDVTTSAPSLPPSYYRLNPDAFPLASPNPEATIPIATPGPLPT